MRNKWLSVFLLVLLALAFKVPAWANEELHPGSRLFFPLWDVSTPSRVTFIIVTREALNEGQRIASTIVGSNFIEKTKYTVSGTGNCTARGRWDPFSGGGGEDLTSDINRTDLGGTSANPIFVDDLHFEYYGKNCSKADEVVHMSCADIDVFLLASRDNKDGLQPRRAFDAVADEKRGALDVHRIDNGSDDPIERQNDDSLMGHAVISELSEGWAAVYPAAAAKATFCPLCGAIDQGDWVGYEAYPMEAYLPFAFADDFTSPGGHLRNILSLWSPALMPAGDMVEKMGISWKWWDGRERSRTSSISGHSIIRPLGGTPIAGLDSPIDPSGFQVSNFVCGHVAGSGGKAENDGFPRNQTGRADACSPGNLGAPNVADPSDQSDNFEKDADINAAGHSIQASIPIGWWRFQLRKDNSAPNPFGFFGSHSGRGLVGVNLSTVAGNTEFEAVGDAWRLWHKDPCRIADSAATWGPPHLRDAKVWQAEGKLPWWVTGAFTSLFNVGNFFVQEDICDGNIFDSGFAGFSNLSVGVADEAAGDVVRDSD
jgi:hypothetical protein